MGEVNKYTFTLHYFNMRGRGEIVRYLFKYTGTPFNDHRMTNEEWAEFKPNSPTGQLPLLEIHRSDNSELLVQSGAIIRHLANVLGVAGRTPIEMARADEAFESIREVLEATGKIFFAETPEMKAKAMDQLLTEVIPRCFGFLEKRLVANHCKNLAGGDSYTYADLFLAQFIDGMMRFKGMDLAPMSGMLPNLLSHAKKVNEHPNIAAYLENRPDSEM